MEYVYFILWAILMYWCCSKDSSKGIYKSPVTALLPIKHSSESFIPRKFLILSLFMNQYHKDLWNEKEHSNFPRFKG